jgi:hypothetical protein
MFTGHIGQIQFRQHILARTLVDLKSLFEDFAVVSDSGDRGVFDEVLNAMVVHAVFATLHI